LELSLVERVDRDLVELNNFASASSGIVGRPASMFSRIFAIRVVDVVGVVAECGNACVHWNSSRWVRAERPCGG